MAAYLKNLLQRNQPDPAVIRPRTRLPFEPPADSFMPPGAMEAGSAEATSRPDGSIPEYPDPAITLSPSARQEHLPPEPAHTPEPLHTPVPTPAPPTLSPGLSPNPEITLKSSQTTSKWDSQEPNIILTNPSTEPPSTPEPTRIQPQVNRGDTPREHLRASSAAPVLPPQPATPPHPASVRPPSTTAPKVEPATPVHLREATVLPTPRSRGPQTPIHQAPHADPPAPTVHPLRPLRPPPLQPVSQAGQLPAEDPSLAPDPAAKRSPRLLPARPEAILPSTPPAQAIHPKALPAAPLQEATRTSQPPAGRAPAPAPPAIHVTIGRIEVRATTPTRQTAPAPMRQPTLSLDDYLKQRNGTAR